MNERVLTTEHFVITRFSIRRPAAPHAWSVGIGRSGRDRDPLEPEALEARFRVFEVACLPGVLAQTSQDFTWVLAIDRDMPIEARARLRALVSTRPRTVIHEYDPASPLTGIAWLLPYLEDPRPDYLMTSNLDDDDSLPTRWVESLQGLITDRGDQLAPLEIFGARSLWEWDLDVTRRAPLGYRAPWHRGGIPVVSVGFTLLARYPTYDLTVMRLGHASARLILDWAVEDVPDRIQVVRSEVKEAALAAGDSLIEIDASETFHDWVPIAGKPTMTNHGMNLQLTRLYEPKERMPVTGAESFPESVMDWTAFERYSDTFRADPRTRIRVRARILTRPFRRGFRRIKRLVMPSAAR
jgi:hypothetical protein